MPEIRLGYKAMSCKNAMPAPTGWRRGKGPGPWLTLSSVHPPGTMLAVWGPLRHATGNNERPRKADSVSAAHWRTVVPDGGFREQIRRDDRNGAPRPR